MQVTPPSSDGAPENFKSYDGKHINRSFFKNKLGKKQQLEGTGERFHLDIRVKAETPKPEALMIKETRESKEDPALRSEHSPLGKLGAPHVVPEVAPGAQVEENQ